MEPPHGLIDRTCPVCGSVFRDSAKHNRKTCSIACSTRARELGAEDRFWAKVAKGPGCWEWGGRRDARGYGLFYYFARQGRAHRFSYELHHEPIPPGLSVCHHCDNPPCVNPNHLFLGTNADNNADMVSKGRHGYGPLPRRNHQGEAHPQAKVTEADVREIRALNTAGVGYRRLARQFGLGRNGIRAIVLRKSWAHVI